MVFDFKQEAEAMVLDWFRVPISLRNDVVEVVPPPEQVYQKSHS